MLHLAPIAFVLTLACQESAPMDDPKPAQHSNALADETSPYLLQHAHNPVDWHPWGPEALALSKQLDKPIFLSVGYSACHWCHVMERESFEDERIAALMNEYFVCIKIDREERPDIDEVYMTAVQAMTGSGGWPMSVFMTPDLEPFFGGTYFPPEARYGRPSFEQVLDSLHKAWEEDRENVLKQGKALADHLAKVAAPSGAGALGADILDRALVQTQSTYDPAWGGFGSAPKFPHTADIKLLLRQWKRTGDVGALNMATFTLDKMAEGGIFDQLGGGFARYSTDEKWLIPHFEKMLYDNALLVPLYVEAYQATGEERFARVARETCEWMLDEMQLEGGGIASSLDADSDGVEGLFYAWNRAQLDAALGEQLGGWAAAWYGVTEEGNFEHGLSALWRNTRPGKVAHDLGIEQDDLEAAMLAARVKLAEAREARVHPAKDDKVLAGWNGMAIGALARAGSVLGEPRFVDGARAAANFVLDDMRQEGGHLFATARAGKAHLDAYMDDYAYVIAGLLDLYEADFDVRWIREALALNAILEAEFRAEDGGYFVIGVNHEKLLVRMRSGQDGATPAGLGIQALNLARLAELTGDGKFRTAAEKTIKAVGVTANRFPAGFNSTLIAYDFIQSSPFEVVISGEPGAADTRALLQSLRGHFLPNMVVSLARSGLEADAQLLAPMEGKFPTTGQAARAFVCRNYTCKAPVTEAAAMLKELQ